MGLSTLNVDMVGHGCSLSVQIFLSILGLAIYLATFPSHVGAWGVDGHHTTCLLAEVNA